MRVAASRTRQGEADLGAHIVIEALKDDLGSLVQPD